MNISLKFHENMVLTAEFFGHQHQNIYYLPDKSLKLVIDFFLRSINGAVGLKKKTAPNNCKDFVKKLLVAFNTNKSNLVFGLEVLACDRF